MHFHNNDLRQGAEMDRTSKFKNVTEIITSFSMVIVGIWGIVQISEQLELNRELNQTTLDTYLVEVGKAERDIELQDRVYLGKLTGELTPEGVELTNYAAQRTSPAAFFARLEGIDGGVSDLMGEVEVIPACSFIVIPWESIRESVEMVNKDLKKDDGETFGEELLFDKNTLAELALVVQAPSGKWYYQDVGGGVFVVDTSSLDNGKENLHLQSNDEDQDYDRLRNSRLQQAFTGVSPSEVLDLVYEVNGDDEPVYSGASVYNQYKLSSRVVMGGQVSSSTYWNVEKNSFSCN
ncbi:hypothetical protein [Corynebacterium renale]|uniref:hypothetical protein n=1 Tax=Corynebacterium renale TaxID=1724 RepID=UPI000DF94D8C|nr:hypothetical protein [Corynebacterium renale]STC99766.1 Uncharacterised protein [Corynebacterium renale]